MQLSNHHCCYHHHHHQPTTTINYHLTLLPPPLLSLSLLKPCPIYLVLLWSSIIYSSIRVTLFVIPKLNVSFFTISHSNCFPHLVPQNLRTSKVLPQIAVRSSMHISCTVSNGISLFLLLLMDQSRDSLYLLSASCYFALPSVYIMA